MLRYLKENAIFSIWGVAIKKFYLDVWLLRYKIMLDFNILKKFYEYLETEFTKYVNKKGNSYAFETPPIKYQIKSTDDYRQFYGVASSKFILKKADLGNDQYSISVNIREDLVFEFLNQLFVDLHIRLNITDIKMIPEEARDFLKQYYTSSILKDYKETFDKAISRLEEINIRKTLNRNTILYKRIKFAVFIFKALKNLANENTILPNIKEMKAIHSFILRPAPDNQTPSAYLSSEIDLCLLSYLLSEGNNKVPNRKEALMAYEKLRQVYASVNYRKRGAELITASLTAPAPKVGEKQEKQLKSTIDFIKGTEQDSSFFRQQSQFPKNQSKMSIDFIMVSPQSDTSPVIQQSQSAPHESHPATSLPGLGKSTGGI